MGSCQRGLHRLRHSVSKWNVRMSLTRGWHAPREIHQRGVCLTLCTGISARTWAAAVRQVKQMWDLAIHPVVSRLRVVQDTSQVHTCNCLHRSEADACAAISALVAALVVPPLDSSSSLSSEHFVNRSSRAKKGTRSCDQRVNIASGLQAA